MDGGLDESKKEEQMDKYEDSCSLDSRKEDSACELRRKEEFTGPVKGAENARSQLSIMGLARGYESIWAILRMELECSNIF